jgi:hypothetical protein
MRAEAGVYWECYEIGGSSSAGEWRHGLTEELDRHSDRYGYDVLGQSLRIWERHSQAKPRKWGELEYRDGIEIERVRLGGRSSTIHVGVTMARLYFRHGDDQPLRESAWSLFPVGDHPPVLRHIPLLPAVSEIIGAINRGQTRPRLSRGPACEVESVSDRVTYNFGGSASSLRDVSMSGMARRLLEIVRSETAWRPAKVVLGSVGFAQRPHSPKAISEEVARVLVDWGCPTELQQLKPDQVASFLESSGKGHLLLIALSGRRGEEPPSQAMSVMRAANLTGVPFQLCSTTVVPTYSRHGLATAILAKCGGSLYEAKAEGVEEFGNARFVGLDLGRGGQYRGKVVAMAMTRSDGSLQAHWRASKGEDETLNTAVLRQGLEWIRGQAGPDAGHFFVVRDGIVPHNEPLAVYKEVFGDDLTLIESAKSGTGLVHCGSGAPEPGTMVKPKDGEFTILYPCSSPQSGVLTQPIKFRVRHDVRDYSASDIASVITALCHSATLSFQPSRLPAPVYWADGMTHLSNADLQFGGWEHLPSELVKLEVH